ncbi:TetR/AcrR family transcriptional regulator [Tenacibaculum sp. SG-28]|uniref:TetR/AcrR family transcriptional regulator n=1 Tax=Tenacibaculum sp. SG-28 TaxID=754426 RepID=UPI001E4D6418|nr:TetR/AcrR family transcriptional regulator [Tenacibaculum sp. SG-28]
MFQIKIDPKFYTKNPESSELGMRIVSASIQMINDLGFESFTFKKLGTTIGSNESSIYRYFENKHALLVYLVNWYWSWIEYKLVFATLQVSSSMEQLKIAIALLTQEVKEDNSFSFINEVALSKIIISESSKAYHTKNIDLENEKGYYKSYKQVVKRVAAMVNEINPKFLYPNMLISTVIEGAHQQRYFSNHLPSLTDVEEGKNNIVLFYTDMVFKTITN